MFVQPRTGQSIVAEGDCLGEMKRELADRRIVQYGAGAPKFYYEVHVDPLTGGDAQAEVMCRGATLHYSAAQLLTWQRIREMIFTHFDLRGNM
jgi:hypothetical protein